MKLNRRQVHPRSARRPRNAAARARRVRIAIALWALLWVAGVVAAIVVPESSNKGPRAVPPPKTTCAGPQIGVHSTLPVEADEQRSATVAAIHDVLRAQVVRVSISWNQIEPIEGRFHWSATDRTIEELSAAGIEPLLVVFGSPSWANGVPQSTPHYDLRVPPRGAAFDTWVSQYADFLRAAVERYHDYVRRWEIWNEPNLTLFWKPRPDLAAYRRLYEGLRSTILLVDPTAQVAVGGLGGLITAPAPSIPGLAFLRGLVRAHAPLDNVAIHPYPTGGHPPDLEIPGENNFTDIGRVRRQLTAEGVRAAIWVTEWGWSSASVGKRHQAQYVGRSLAMLRHRYRFVRVATYFLDHDLSHFFEGLLDEHLKPKPAAGVFRKHAEGFASMCHPTQGGS